MLTSQEQDHILRLVERVTTATLRLAQANRSAAPRTDPRAARQSLQRVKDELRDYLKEVG